MSRRSSRSARRRRLWPAESDVAPAGVYVDAGAVAELARLYDGLPSFTCRGLCAASCGEHVDASRTELARALAAGADLTEPTLDGACPALRSPLGAGRCSIHDIRPMVCRLWGISAALPCPHGCVPDGGHLSDAQTLELMLAALEAGGHDDASPLVRDLVATCLDDPEAAPLLAQFLRGDRSSSDRLQQRVLELHRLSDRVDRAYRAD